jgi:hypothetical protein
VFTISVKINARVAFTFFSNPNFVSGQIPFGFKAALHGITSWNSRVVTVEAPVLGEASLWGWAWLSE